MSILKYLFDKKYLIFVYVSMTLFTGIILYIDRSTNKYNSNNLYSIEVSFFVFSVYLTIDYLFRRFHLNKLIRISKNEGIDWVNSLPAPIDSEQRIYTDLLEKLYDTCNTKLLEYDRANTEYIEFLTMWVHEIKTPISASKLIIENSLNAPTEKTLYSLEDEINKIEDFVQMTLYYSRTKSFANDYRISTANVGNIVRECISKEYSILNNKKINLSMNNIDIEIDTDEKWLGFIIKQILDNSFKYSEVGGKIRIYAETLSKESILNIEDGGIGIIQEDLKRVFDKTFTGLNGRTLYNSTGLGLYLSQKLARRLGHYISINSEYGYGTKVSIHFPKWSGYFDLD